MKVGNNCVPTFISVTFLASCQKRYRQKVKHGDQRQHSVHQLRENPMGIMEMFAV